MIPRGCYLGNKTAELRDPKKAKNVLSTITADLENSVNHLPFDDHHTVLRENAFCLILQVHEEEERCCCYCCCYRVDKVGGFDSCTH